MSHVALVVDRRGAALELGHDRTLVVRHADGNLERVGLLALDCVVLNGDVQLSSRVLRTLAEHRVGLVMLPVRGRAPAVTLSRTARGAAALRHAQHCCYADPVTRLALARAVVRHKLLSQQAHHGAHGQHTLPKIEAGLDAAADLDALRGMEGAAAAAHFARIAEALPAPWNFHGRNRRPPRDPFNALLSLGYTLAQEEALRLGLRNGLDAEIGFLHGLASGRSSMALDLVEPARPAVDAWLLGLVRDAAFRPHDFHDNEADGCRLSVAARQSFFQRWFAQGQALAREAMQPLLAELLRRLRERASDRCGPEATADEEQEEA